MNRISGNGPRISLPLCGLLVAGILSWPASSGADTLRLLQERDEGPAKKDDGATSRGMMFERVERGTYASVGFLHEFATDFGDGGSVAVDRAFGSVGTEFQLHPDFKGSASLAWGGDWYRFDGDVGLSPDPDAKPWTDAQAVTALVFGNWQIDPRWSANLGLRLGFAGESGSRLKDSLTYGGNVALSYSFSRELTLGGGVLVVSQIEDDPLIIPLVVVFWQVTDSVIVSNVLGPEAYPTGAGAEIAWRPDQVSELAIGSRYEVRRFRLDDSGPARRQRGVGEDRGLPLWARATWRFGNGLRFDLVGGVSLMNKYRLDDRNGDRIGSADLDPAPFIAAFASWRF
ncbi:MAG: hypothetical protein VX672_00140 [Planctomycetota bacterium]|nr:hypothetical protein [Planctomycetota bacterium]